MGLKDLKVFFRLSKHFISMICDYKFYYQNILYYSVCLLLHLIIYDNSDFFVTIKYLAHS